MNGETMTVAPRIASTRSAFSDRTNPNRPAPTSGGSCRETRGGARLFPERCDPRHAHRPLTDEQRERATRYMPMARAIARQVGGKLVDQDELEAEAYAALVDAARTFDPSRGVDFAVYARPRISGAIRDYRRFLFHADRRGNPEGLPVFQRLAITDEIHGRLIGMEPDPPVGRDLELPEAVASAVRRLPRPLAIACRSIYFEGKSYEETAAVLGCTKTHVSRLHGEALDRLRYAHGEALAG